MWSCSVIDLTGQTFGRLTVLRLVGTNKHNKRLWECVCECGSIVTVIGSHLKNGNTKSCWCLNKDVITTHGMCKSRVYQIWADMKTRIDCATNQSYPDYGGRGITYDPAWKHFDCFWEQMKEGYSDELTLDRIDVNGNYCKENCRWATDTVQQHNQRKKAKCSSIYKGVCWNKESQKWQANIKIDKKTANLGVFLSELEAALAYDNASELYYGDRPNKTVREE